MSDETAARMRAGLNTDPEDDNMIVWSGDLRALLDERDRMIEHHAKQAQDIMTLSDELARVTESRDSWEMATFNAGDELARLRAPVGEAGEVTSYLRERTALRYMGDCKCGQCRLVERPQLDAAADLIIRQSTSLREAATVIKGMIAVADRATVEFEAAHAWLAKHGGDSEGR